MKFFKKPLLNIINNHLINYPTPININFAWNFGFISAVCLIIQILTGIFISMHYTPHILFAFLSVENIMRNVQSGWILRYIHSNGASFFFIATYIHILRSLYFGSYIKPKQTVWVLGIIIFFLMIITAFLGYVLPWGQMSYWGATVITSLATAIPYIGNYLIIWLWGDFSISNAALNRFFSLHYILPIIISAIVFLHLTALHFDGSNNPLGLHSIFDKISIYPYFILKDFVGICFFLIVFSLFLTYYPNVLNHEDNYIKANSLITPHLIIPEWYFLLAPSNLHSACWTGRSTWFTLITIKTTDLSESSNRSLVRKNRRVQHVGEGIPGFIQRSLRCISSYCKYVYLSFEKQGVISSIKSWNTLWFTALWNTSKKFRNRVAVMLSTNSGRNQYAKFTKISFMEFLGGDVLKNFGIA